MSITSRITELHVAIKEKRRINKSPLVNSYIFGFTGKTPIEQEMFARSINGETLPGDYSLEHIVLGPNYKQTGSKRS